MITMITISIAADKLLVDEFFYRNLDDLKESLARIWFVFDLLVDELVPFSMNKF